MKPLAAESSVKAFLFKIFLWLPIIFTAWYFLAPVLNFPVVLLANEVLPRFVAYAVEAVEHQGALLDVVTSFAMPAAPGSSSSAGQGQLIFSVNAMKYGYGLPLLLTMILASPDNFNGKFLKFCCGYLLILLTQLWGVSFDVMKVLVFNLGPEIAGQMQTTPGSREIIALGYQFGYLILPSITPVTIWFFQYRNFVQKLALKS